MKILRTNIAFAILMLLQACASAPDKPADQPPLHLNQAHLLQLASIKQFTLQGRMGVQAEGKGFSGGITWQHQPELDEISLNSPLGGKIAHIQKNTTKVMLTDANGNSISADNIESLTAKTLGWQLPLNGLADWALGRPTNSIIEASTWDKAGHLSTLKQEGWLIEYHDYSTGTEISLPNKITLRNEKIFLKLLVDQWESTSK